MTKRAFEKIAAGLKEAREYVQSQVERDLLRDDKAERQAPVRKAHTRPRA